MNINSIFKKVINSYFLTFFLLLLAFFLRFYKFDTLGFWGDEYLTFWNSEPLHTYNEVFEKTIKSGDLVPPFYYYILNLYNHLLDYTAYSIRFFHIFFGVLSLVIVFFISKFLLSKPSINLVIFLMGFNTFLIWASTEARVVSFALFFHLILIALFSRIIKNLNLKVSFLEIIVLFFFNILVLTIHPLTIVIVLAQIFFLLIMIRKNKTESNKKIFIYIFFIFLSCIIYILINKEFFIWSLNGTRLNHKQLTLNFFLGLNFKHFFTSYILGFINLIIIYLSMWRLKKNIFENLHILFLLIIFIFTYGFIIFGTILFTGFNGQKEWAYLVPIILIINIYYLTKVKKNFLSKIIVVLIVLYTPINYIQTINNPQVRKPDMPGLISAINKSDVNYVVSQNYVYFDSYLRNGYQNILKKEIIYEDKIANLKSDFWYLCLDLVWVQEKGSYYDEIYNCSPKTDVTKRFKRFESLKINGFVITKFKLINK